MLATTAFAGAPDEPRQLDFDNLEKEIGKRGGSLKMLMAKPKDVRWMTVYSGARLVAYDETFQLMPDLFEIGRQRFQQIFHPAPAQGT